MNVIQTIQNLTLTTVRNAAMVLALSLSVAGTASAATVTPGVWGGAYATAKAYSEAHHIPLVVFWGNPGCSACASLSDAVATSEFKSWMSDDGTGGGASMVFVHIEGTATDDAAACKAFAKTCNGNSLLEFPFIRIYWPKEDGGLVTVNFTGRSSTLLFGGATLAAKFINAIEHYTWGSGYTGTHKQYAGGYFAVTNSPSARLEASPATEYVDVPLFRTETGATNQPLVASIGSRILANMFVTWPENQTNHLVRLSGLAGEYSDGASVSLKLMDGETVASQSSITFVNPTNSVKNPYWLGEKDTTGVNALNFGEWTMDLDAAKAIVSASPNSARTLVLASGVLWCPYCKSLESSVLDNDVFKDWVRANNIALVVLDNPKRSADDIKDANGQLIAVGTKANGAPPTLLRYAETAAGVSGAGYLSRKMIPVLDAEAVLQRNHDLLYQGGTLAAPESLRTGYPTFILLNKDGTVAGRLLDGCNGPARVWGLSAEETINRLNELLLLTGGEGDSKPSTTTLSYAIESVTNGSVQVNANTKCYRLVNVPAGKVTFSVNAPKDVSLAVCETPDTLSNARLLAAGGSQVTVDFTSVSNKYLVVSAYTNSLAATGVNTTFNYELSSRVTLAPTEMRNSFTPQAASVGMDITTGTVYKLAGFSNESLSNFTANADGTYTALQTGTAVLAPAAVGSEVSYQIWAPGTIAFTVDSQRFLESMATGTISVVRTGGVSGRAAVSVCLRQSTLTPGRLTVEPSTDIIWEEGETGEKPVAFSVVVDTTFQVDETFTMNLVKTVTPDNAAVLGVTTNHTVTVSDTDNPILGGTDYAFRLYKNFAAAQSYHVYNILENGRVTLSRVSGMLPSGVSLKYDAATQSLVLSGKPSLPGEFSYVFTISERRVTGTKTGLPIRFNISVVAPNELDAGDPDYNPAVGTVISTTLPVLAAAGDTNVLGGVLSVSVTRNNRVTAKFTGALAKVISFSGYWQSMSDGVASAELATRTGELLVLGLTGDGRLHATISNISSEFGSDFTTPDDGVPALQDQAALARYAGFYTVTLPAMTNGLTEVGETLALGTGYVTLKMNSSTFLRYGTVSYAGMLADGSKISGSTTLLPYSDYALLPIFKRSSSGKYSVGLVLSVRPDAASTYEEDPMVVLADASTQPYWYTLGEFIPLEVYGGYYDPMMNLLDCCEGVYETEVFGVTFDTAWFAPSERFGGIAELPNAAVSVNSVGLTVQNSNALLKLTFSLSKRTGIVSGRIPVQFANGQRITLSYKGVLLPGWNDCGCTDVAPLKRPFASGAAYYQDRVGGVSVKRGFSIDLVPILPAL